MLLQEVKLTAEPYSPAITLIERLKEVLRILDYVNKEVRRPPSITDLILNSNSQVSNAQELPLADFLTNFFLLINAGWKELTGNSHNIENLLSGLWTMRLEASNTKAQSLLEMNPIVLTLGHKNFKSALKNFFASKITGKITFQNRMKIHLMPDCFFIVLNWDSYNSDNPAKILTHFNAKEYVKPGVKYNYLLYALLFRNTNNGKYILHIRKETHWVLFEDAHNYPLDIKAEVSSQMYYQNQSWRCAMVIYKYAKHILLRDFDITKPAAYYVELYRQRNLRKLGKKTNQKDDTMSYSSESEDTSSSSSSSKKRRRSSTSSVERRSKNSSLPPDNISRPVLLSEAAVDVLDQVLQAEKPFLQIRREEFPRIHNIAVFLRDVYITESEFKGNLRNVLYTKFAGQTDVSQSVQFEWGSKSRQLIEQYKRFAMRVLLAHYGSLYAKQKPESYGETLIYSCACVDTVYTIDKAFFSTARDNLRTLRRDLPSTSGSTSSPLRELELDFVAKATAKGLIFEGASSSAGQQNDSAESSAQLKSILADPQFYKLKSVVTYLQSMNAAQALDPSVREVLEAARTAYLENKYKLK